MSKKTKLEKILARQRRLEQITTQVSVQNNSTQYSITPPTKKDFSQSVKSTITTTVDHKYVSKDLVQTLVLTLLAIAAQLCVYYLIELKHFQFKF